MPGSSRLGKILASEERLQIGNIGLGLAAGTVALAAIADIGLRAGSSASSHKHMQEQERNLRRQQKKDEQARSVYENPFNYSNVVQNQYTNRMGHYKQGNAKYK